MAMGTRLLWLGGFAAAQQRASAAGDPTQADDWLVGWAAAAPAALVEGSLGGVPTLTLSNGLISRVFAMPRGPPAVGGQASAGGPVGVCPNPGGKVVHGPSSRYPYYGLECQEESDCGQCATDKTCLCCANPNKTAGPMSAKCCVPAKASAGCKTPAPPPAINYTGWATVGLSRVGAAGREADTGAQLLRASAPEALVVLDNVSYAVGGLLGQADYAFLNTSLLHKMRVDPAAFVYKQHRQSTPTARFPWVPGVRHSDATAAWPPRGLTLEIDFGAPPSCNHAAHKAVIVTVTYEIYDGVPLYSKWVRVANSGAASVVVTGLTTELLYATNEALGYWSHLTQGSLTAVSSSGRIHMESEMSRGGGTTTLGNDHRCTTCTQGSSASVALTSTYPLGPGAQIGQSGFHGRDFTSFHTYVLLHDSDDTERQGLAVKRMYRTLAPQITENPTFMHLTKTTPAGIRAAVDQCAEVGFEMIILSFGSGLDMESKSELYIESIAESVKYAHSKGIQIGGYNLMSSSRHVGHGGDCLGPDGKPDGASCLASEWADDYFATIQHFINRTGFDMIETDGPYEGAKCSSTTHAHHMGEADSVWTQYERNMEFYAWCKARGMYIHAPDPFYMRGINKDGMGYVETNWNLPLWEQINLARQNIYDGTWTKAPSQGWMFVPLTQYHGGWPECCIEPAGFMAGQWEWYLALYFGTGVSPCYRGYRLYNELVPASKALVQKWTAFNARYRVVLHADIVHLKRADGNTMDAMLHVQPDTSKSQERAFLMVFNQNPGVAVNTTLRVPLYYSGLSTVANVTRDDGSSFMLPLARDWTVQLPLTMEPHSFAWFAFE